MTERLLLAIEEVCKMCVHKWELEMCQVQMKHGVILARVMYPINI